MRILILGHADAEGFGEPLETKDGGLVVFTEADLEKAKLKHVFPKGVKHLKAYRLEENLFDNAVFIGDDVTATYADSEQREAQLARSESEKRERVANANKPLAEARARVQATAKERNELMGRLHSAKARLQAHDATPETLRGETHAKTVEELQRLILGDPEKENRRARGSGDPRQSPPMTLPPRPSPISSNRSTHR